MKVQLKGQTLRLRIDEAELGQLLAGETLDNATHWPDGQHSHQQLMLADDCAWQRLDNGWCIKLPEMAIHELAIRLPSRDGLQFDLSAPGGAVLKILFDVDIRDSARRLRKQRKGE